MITIGVSSTLNGGSTNATTVNATVTGCTVDNGTPPVAQTYNVIYQGQLASAVAAQFTNASNRSVLINSIHLFNTASSIQTVTLAVGGNATSNNIATIVIPGNGFADYEDGSGWTIYSSAGIVVTGGVLINNGLGTPASATTALTAATEVLQGGTLFQLPTSYLAVGQRYRWHIGIEKTAAGTATWVAKVKFGTNGTTADAAIATWTSGTNTAAIDQCTLDIECRITALGSGTSATAACTAFYVNTLTNATGLGRIDPVPTPTAGFDSTAATPYMHVDITAGASAVMTGVGMAEQVA